VEIKIFEKNADVGGTWLENRYPGMFASWRMRVGCKAQ
jgi:cation diffusion facilitator CzcD-associated flavoprotein CzcO